MNQKDFEKEEWRGQVLRLRRLQFDIEPRWKTQRAWAVRLGISQAFLSRIENGHESIGQYRLPWFEKNAELYGWRTTEMLDALDIRYASAPSRALPPVTPELVVPIKLIDGEARVSSRYLAEQTGNQHHAAMQLITKYLLDFERFSRVAFEMETLDRVSAFEMRKPQQPNLGGRPTKTAYLTEDQAYLLLAYSQNTPQARELKIKLVQAFSLARSAPQVQANPYPTLPLAATAPVVDTIASADPMSQMLNLMLTVRTQQIQLEERLKRLER